MSFGALRIFYLRHYPIYSYRKCSFFLVSSIRNQSFLGWCPLSDWDCRRIYRACCLLFYRFVIQGCFVAIILTLQLFNICIYSFTVIKYIHTLHFQVNRIYRADPKAQIIFNCQMGRGRTTTGMVIATLVYLNRIGASGNFISYKAFFSFLGNYLKKLSHLWILYVASILKWCVAVYPFLSLLFWWFQ